MEDMKEAVVTIQRNDYDKFNGHSKESTGWCYLDHEFLKRNFSTLELYFYKRLHEKDIEGQDTETYITFLVTFDTTKSTLLCTTTQLKIEGGI